MDVWPQNDFKLKMHTIKHLIKIFSTFLDTWETLRTLIRFEDPYNVPIKLMEVLFKIYLNSRTRVTSGIKGQFRLILIVHRFPCSMLVCLFSYNPLCLFCCLDSILSNSIYVYAGRAMMPIEYLVLVLILKSASFHDACHSTCYMWRLFVMYFVATQAISIQPLWEERLTHGIMWSYLWFFYYIIPPQLSFIHSVPI